jgi:tetratricopeptide (TPR) repeat protein
LQLESRSPRAALDWTKDRALTSLLRGGEDVGFEDAMTRAKDVGVAEDKYAFARVASFLYQGDTAGAAGAMAHWDGPAGGDAWFQLIAGATLERAGDARARDRYALSAKIDPGLFPAQVALARAMAIDGDPAEAKRLAAAVRAQAPDRAEGIALVALAWARDPRRDENTPPPEVDAVLTRGDELPVGLRAVPSAILAMRALDKRAADEARTQVHKGLALADSPGMAVWLGTLALPLGDEALSRKAALAALQMSAAYTPARSLAARVALLGGRLDEALKATEELDATSPDVAVVRAAAAYERVDLDALARAIESLSPEARKLPFVQAFASGPDQLLGKVHVEGAKLVAFAADEAPWRDLVSMDTALDDGDLVTADKIAVMWGKEAETQPLRALRLARLARYEGRLDAADALSQVAMDRGTVTPRVLSERAFTLVARNRAAEVGPLLGRYPLVFGPVGSWMGAYASASSGTVEVAKGRVASLDPAPSGAPLLVRVVAAAAFGAMKDRRRGADYVKDVLSTGSLDPDLVAAATALGFKKVEHGKKHATYE